MKTFLIILTIAVVYGVIYLVKRKQKIRDIYNDNLIDTKEKEYYYRGRKTEQEWKEWFSDMLNSKN